MWYFLKRFLQLLGNRVFSRMMPRLIFFQYYNRIGLELQEKKKKLKLHQRPLAQALLIKSLDIKQSKKLGLSALSQQNLNSHEINALQVNDGQLFMDDKTVSSHYEMDNYLDQSFEFIEMQNSIIVND